MTSVYPIQAIFSKGEASPRLHARVDAALYMSCAQHSPNFIPMVQGGVFRRSGTRYIHPSSTDMVGGNVRIIPFIFSSDQSYAMEFGDQKVRLFANGGIVMDGGSPFEIAVPYTQDQLWDFDFVQVSDTIFIVHPEVPIFAMQRMSETNWETRNVELRNGPFLPIYTGDNQLLIGSAGKPSASYSASTTGSEGGSASVAFDDDPNTFWSSTAGNQNSYLTMDLSGAQEYGINGVRLTFTTQTNWPNEQMAPNSFRIQGRRNGSWVTVYQRTGETGWSFGESRTFTWTDDGQKYDAFRYQIDSNNGSTWSVIGDINFSLIGVPVDLSWESTDGINDGLGLVDPDDIGRLVRYQGPDGIWRVVEISNILSPTSFEGTQDGFWLSNPQSSPAGAWQLGAISVQAGYPASVTLFQDRMVFGGTKSAPNTIFLSKTSDYTNFGISEPVQDDDSISFGLQSEQQDGIEWVREMQNLLFSGNNDTIQSLGGTASAALSANNVESRTQTANGTAIMVRPERVGRSIIIAGEHAKDLRSLMYSEAAGAFDAIVISDINEHLFKDLVKQMAWAEGPDYQLAVVKQDGSMAIVTYENDQNVNGAVPIIVGGADVKILTVASIPEDNRHAFYVVVERTINNQTRRYVERFEAMFEYQDDTEAWFVDSGIPFTSGTPTQVITGLEHLEGETVEVFGYNTASTSNVESVSNIRVVNGQITVPMTVTNAVIGIAYEARLRPMRYNGNAPDGSAFGRRVRIDGVIVDLFRSRGVYLVPLDGQYLEDIVPRADQDLMDEYVPLFTGTKPNTKIDGSWEKFGQFDILTEGPYPCMIRAITPIAEGEP